MESIEIVGLIAAILTTGAYVPQVFKVIKSKSTKDISLTMYSVMLIGVVLWFIYGLHHRSLAIILANAVTGILVLVVVLFKLKHK